MQQFAIKSTGTSSVYLKSTDTFFASHSFSIIYIFYSNSLQTGMHVANVFRIKTEMQSVVRFYNVVYIMDCKLYRYVYNTFTPWTSYILLYSNSYETIWVATFFLCFLHQPEPWYTHFPHTHHPFCIMFLLAMPWKFQSAWDTYS